MTTNGPLTEANQQEMKRQLEELASNHKKAKLQELFTRQDELRPYPITINKINETTNNNMSNVNIKPESPRNTNRSNEEIEAMKNQFNDLQKSQLNKQISAQFLLRLPDESDACETYERERDSSGSSGDQKLNEADEADMRAEFDKYQKKILSTQIEKSFRLRTPLPTPQTFSNETINEMEVMEKQFNALNKMMVRMRSTKTLEMGIVNLQIKPKHKEQFNILMKDIGIVNQVILDKLWANIENIVKQTNEINEDSLKTDDDFDDNITELQRENELLRQQIKSMQKQMKKMKQMK